MNKNPGFIYMDSPITIQFRLSGYQDGDAAYEKERFTGETLHISERGMVLLVKHPVPEESFVTLTFCGERSGTCEKLIGKIKKVEACREESFLVSGISVSS